MQITSNTIFISWNYQFILFDCFFLLPSWSFIDASALVLFCFLPFLSSFPWWKSHSLHACRGAVFLRALEFSSVILHFLFLGNLFSWKDHSFLHSVSTFSLHLFLSTQSALKLCVVLTHVLLYLGLTFTLYSANMWFSLSPSFPLLLLFLSPYSTSCLPWSLDTPSNLSCSFVFLHHRKLHFFLGLLNPGSCSGVVVVRLFILLCLHPPPPPTK